jgi:hypothetical protein
MASRVLRKPKKKVHVRAKERRRGLEAFGYGVFRFCIYGLFGVALEIVFYNLVRNLRDVPVLGLLFRFDWQVDPALDLSAIWKVPALSLYGQCSLWMFFVYGVASFCIEFVYRNGSDVPWPIRAGVYGFIIFLWECLSGWLLYWGTGYRIWFYADPGNFLSMTSWRILPIWCVTGLVVEYLYRQLMDPDLVHAIETSTLKPEVT